MNLTSCVFHHKIIRYVFAKINHILPQKVSLLLTKKLNQKHIIWMILE